MSRTPHPQVLSPCADDAVSIGQALGTRGDVAFDEYGEVTLTDGQTTVEVEFTYEKENAGYAFEYLYVKSTTDPLPEDIRAVVSVQSKTGFTVELSAEPVSGNAVLMWHVIVPDPLHTCQGATDGPKYAIVPEERHGLLGIPVGQDYIEVIFDTVMAAADWLFESISFENVADDIPQTFAWVCADRNAERFLLRMSGAVSTEGTSLRWQVRGVNGAYQGSPAPDPVCNASENEGISYTVDSIADLRAMCSASLRTDELAQTRGYYIPGDGGGNTFHWSGLSILTDNGGTVIKPTDKGVGAGRWIKI